MLACCPTTICFKTFRNDARDLAWQIDEFGSEITRRGDATMASDEALPCSLYTCDVPSVGYMYEGSIRADDQ